MCVAVGTAVAIAATAASTAGTVYAAKKGSDAAKDAAKTQSDAAEKALKLQQQQYQQQRQDFNPYGQAGATALGRLGGMASAPRQQFSPGPQGPLPQPSQGPGMPQMPTMQPGMGQQQGPMAQTSQQPPQAAQGGEQWTIEAPDGSGQRSFPPAIAQQYIAHGARRVG